MANVETMSLEALVARARDHKMTSVERRAQRVSLVMGLRSQHSTLTREKVVELLGEIEGHDVSSEAKRSLATVA